MDVAGERAVYINVTLRAPDAPGYHFTKEWNTGGEPRGRTTKGASESAAIRLGYRLSKGPYRSILTMEQYRLVDVKRKAVVLGERYEASFEAVEQYLNEHTSGTGRKGP